MRHLTMARAVLALLLLVPAAQAGLVRSANDTLEEHGLSVLIHQNRFHPVFFDEKNAAIQIVLHDERIATDGEVRLNPTPEQWDPVPLFVSRSHGALPDQVVVRSGYAERGLTYTTEVTPEPGGFRIVVHLDQPLPKALEGKAGFNLDFLPSAYFGKSYIIGTTPGIFPRTPVGPMLHDGSGDPTPLAQGAATITLAPEDPLVRVSITSDAAPLAIYDARNRAQNGWFVVRSLIAAGRTRDAVVWHVHPHVVPGWTRAPVVSFNQAGYTPSRDKVAIIELDPASHPPATARLLRVEADGSTATALTAPVRTWGRWQRYRYATFDFSGVQAPGIYEISYAGRNTNPFRIAADAYDHIWQPSLDTYLAEQMDHMSVREQYRVWTGLSHMDDARQAPPNTIHFDGYRMGPDLDSPFKAGEHIPGLNVGGWQDAGDYDIQTPDNAWVVRNLEWMRELFGADWDETTIDDAAHAVEIRKPDGISDVLQQIRHGTRQLLAQYHVFGHAIVGIIDPVLHQYTHLGDSGSQTDRLVYDPALGPLEVRDGRSGVPDDRWAFTADNPANDCHVAAALAAAARGLAELDPPMSAEALAAAKVLWANQRDPGARVNRPDRGDWIPRIDTACVSGAVELILSTHGDPLYTQWLQGQMPVIRDQFEELAPQAIRALPFMDEHYRTQLADLARAAKQKWDHELAGTPFGVPITLGTWAGSGVVAQFGLTAYMLHHAFPDIFGKQYTLAAIDFLMGRHPVTNQSLVAGVGAYSKQLMYGHNRADYSFVPGALVPGVIVLKPDFPEQQVDWPFTWFENEATVATTSAFMLEANAALAVLKE
ncbi:MAG TPA: glycoside hydrolase family 9 protein [Burkholderiaceae bacterium]|nr:glycoside hydrolase family 9 protein [Burkholderiaceae bacterium]